MMITSRFGIQVQLVSPVDWNSGWVNARFEYEDQPEFRPVHVSDLRADDGLNEIQTTSDALKLHVCRDCGEHMEVVQQERVGAVPLTLVTCKNKICTLWSVTLSTEQYAQLSEEKLTAYRDMVASLKLRFGANRD